MRRLFVVGLLVSAFFEKVSGQTHLANPVPITVYINSGNPKFPFPQFLDYKGGKTLGRQNAIGVTDFEMEKTIREAYQIMMNRANYTGDVQDGVKYIEFDSQCLCSGTCSEGDGFALLAAAYMGDKTTFDGLWAFVHDNRLNAVKQYKNCNKVTRANYQYGVNTIANCASETFHENDGGYYADDASDGDFDIALALLVANYQWGTQKILTTKCGVEVSYQQEAINLLKALTDTVFFQDGSNPPNPRNDPSGGNGYYVGDIGFDGYVKNGNSVGEMTQWIYNNTTAPNNKGYLWNGRVIYARNAAPQSNWLDYIAPSYFRSFADFLSNQDSSKYSWNVNQYRRATASSDWLMGQINAQGKYPTGGNYSITGITPSFNDANPAEDSRNPWRTILNYVWHGNPTTSWNPTTHEVVNSGNTFEYNNAIKLAQLVQFNEQCIKLGNDPTALMFKGVATLGDDISMTGVDDYGIGKFINWNFGSIAPSIVAYHLQQQTDKSFDELADWYNRLVLLWDGTAMNTSDPLETQRYIKSKPGYFHDWYRVLGLLVVTGNYQSPQFMSQAIKANLKVYNEVDKTLAYAPIVSNGTIKTPGDVVTYTFSYRNFSSVAATNAQVSFILPDEVEIVSSSATYSISGKNVVWTLPSVPGYTSSGESGNDWQKFNPLAYPSTGKIQLKVRIKPGISNVNICNQVTISADNSDSFTSNEYPNNNTPVMQKNCIDIVERSLTIVKQSDRSIAQNGDVVNYTINFQNLSKTGWISGGRPDVRFTYGNGFSGPNTFVNYYRFLHGAQEPYLNPGNYRVSYFLNDAARIGIYNPPTNVNGWFVATTILEGGDPDKVTFSSEQYTLGQDKYGKWNQRLIVRFADTLMATTQHLNMFFAKPGEQNDVLYVHKGIGDPFRMAVEMEARGSSSACGSIPLAGLFTDDWSYSKAIDIGTDDKSLFTPISPSWFNYQSTYDTSLNVTIMDVHPDACAPIPTQNYDRVLVEEWDGYIWRRILGNGPVAGMELQNVCIRDTLPVGLTWNGFTQSEALGIKATYNASTRVIEWCVPSMLPGASGSISYSTVATSDCSSDKVIYNKAWISSKSSSPIDSSLKLTITCKQIPPLPPPSTSMHKTADKSAYKKEDPIKYIISFKQTQGTIAVPNMASTANWTSHCGEPMLNFNDTKSPGDDAKLITYDYSHGKNGTLITKISPKSAQPFSLVFRYNGDGSPKCTSKSYQGLLLSFVNNSCAQLNINLIQNGSSIGTLTDIAYAAPQDTLTIKVQLQDDKLFLWINNFNALPYVFDKITYTSPGYVGYFNSDGNGNTNESQKLLYWNTNFDSAFEVKLWDKIPAQLTYTASSVKRNYPATVPTTYDQIDPQFTSADSITWKLVTGKIPLLYGDSVAFEFSAVVNDCGPGFITNVTYANILGQPNFQIGAQSVSTCGTPPSTCVPPTSVTTNLKTEPVCVGQKATLHGSYALGTASPLTGYRYVWYKMGSPPSASAYRSTYSDSVVLSTIVASSGTYVLRVEDGTSGDLACYREDTMNLIVNPRPVAGFTWSPVNPVPAGTTVTFTNTSTGATYFAWKLDGTGVTINNTYTFNTAGQYKVRLVATNSTGCKDSLEQTVVVGTATACVPPSSLAPNPASGLVSVCEGDSVSLKAVYSLGANPLNTYRYVWYKKNSQVGDYSNYSTYSAKLFSKTVASTDSGTWIFRLEDGSKGDASCYKEISFLLTVKNLPVVSAGNDTSVCKGSSLLLQGSSPSISPTFTWSKKGSSFTSADARTTLNNATLLDSGRYYLQATSSGCSAKDSLEIKVNSIPSVLLNSDSVNQCGGTVNLSLLSNSVGQKSYYSDTLVPTLLASPIVGTSGTYYIQVAKNGCTSTFKSGGVKVLIRLGPVATINVPSASYCGDKGTTLSASPNGNGEQYAWFKNNKFLSQPSNTTNILNNVLEGNYAVVVTVNGCSSAKSAVTIVTQATSAVPTVLISSDQRGNCTGQNITFTANPSDAIGYEWYVGSSKQLSTTATYATSTLVDGDMVKVVLTTDEACANPKTARDSLVVHFTKPASIKLISDAVLPVCEGTSVLFTATTLSGTISGYQWSVNGQVQPITDSIFLGDKLKKGNKLKVSSLDACSPFTLVADSLVLDLTPTVVPTITLQPVNSPVCQGQKVKFGIGQESGAGDASRYVWSLNSISGDTIASDTMSYIINGTSTVQVTLVSSTLCATPKYAQSNVVAVGVSSGVQPTVAIVSDILSPCPSYNAVKFSITSITGGGTDSTFKWYRGGIVMTGETGTSYTANNALVPGDEVWVVMSSSLPCRTSDTASSNRIPYFPPAPLHVSIEGDVNGTYSKGMCLGDTVSFGTTGLDGASYSWYIDDVLQQGQVSTSFSTSRLREGDSVKVVASLLGCPSADDAVAVTEVSVDTKPRLGFVSGNLVAFCSGGDTVLIPLETNLGYVYTWYHDGLSFGAPGRSSSKITESGDYSLVITNGACRDTSTATLLTRPNYLSVTPPITEFSLGEAVKLTASGGDSVYTWSPASLISTTKAVVTFFPTETMYITVTLITPDGCREVDSALVRKLDKLFIPNAITPETGDQNAFWNIQGAETYPELDVRVYNRWGSLVHEQRGYSTPWDGTLHGKALPTGTYYYVLKDKALGKPRVGDITIVR